jgi:nicotinamide-nucleotide amidase
MSGGAATPAGGGAGARSAAAAANADAATAATLFALAQRLGELLHSQREWLTTAESCTAGGVAYAVTQIAGSSAWFDRGFVTYTNAAKQALLGVPAPLLAAHGAVSEPVARAMATGALAASGAQVAVAITGIAGPGGGSPAKPVGTVCFAWARARGASGAPAHDLVADTRRFAGDRAAVRSAAIIAALQGLIDLLEPVR